MPLVEKSFEDLVKDLKAAFAALDRRSWSPIKLELTWPDRPPRLEDEAQEKGKELEISRPDAPWRP